MSDNRTRPPFSQKLHAGGGGGGGGGGGQHEAYGRHTVNHPI